MSAEVAGIGAVPVAPASAARQNLPAREKFGFGLGDLSSNIVFQAVSNVLLYFYTDVFGLTAAAATLLMAVVRVIDAVIDPAIGAMADRTRSRHGRYRPWLLWLAIPYGVIAVAAFITPGVSEGARLAYAYVSYILLVVVYSAINIPYSALNGVMTADSEERANLQTWRFAMAMVGGFLVTTAIFPLARALGGGGEPVDLQKGFPLAMAILAAIAVLGFFGCFALTKERVYQDMDASLPRPGVWQDIRSMLTNRQWLVIALVTLVIQVRGGMQASSKAYFVDYYLINNYGSVTSGSAWINWLAGIFAVTENLIALFMGLTMLAGVAGVIGQVLTLVTGAAGSGGFKGLGGLHSRRDLLRYGDASAAALRMRRKDSGETVEIVFDASVVPADPEMRTLIPLALAGSAEATARFGAAWQDRVRRLLVDHADDPAAVSVRRIN